MLDHLLQGGEAAAKLLSLMQGGALVADYSIQFHKLPTQWLERRRTREVCYKGLREELKDELAARDDTAFLSQHAFSSSLKLSHS